MANSDDVANTAEAYTGAGPLIAVMLAASVGVLAAIVVLPWWAPTLARSLMGDSPKAYWYLSRGLAFVSLGLLWVSMILGLLITDKLARSWPGSGAAFAIHEYVSLLGLALAALHALVLLGDHYIGYALVDILLPFGSAKYRPVWVGIGQIGFYVWLIVNGSFYVRRQISQSAWKVIHYASFFMFLVALMHGLAAGTDTHSSAAQIAYWIMGGSTLFLMVYRIAASLAGPEPRAEPLPAPRTSVKQVASPPQQLP
jgi:predicted ferric reductase